MGSLHGELAMVKPIFDVAFLSRVVELTRKEQNLRTRQLPLMSIALKAPPLALINTLFTRRYVQCK